MTKEIINTDNAPKAIGPYEQGIKFGNFIFTSGQIPIDPKTNKIIEGDIEAQTELAIKNLEAVLVAGGASLKNVIKTTIFIDNMENFSRVNGVYESFFGKSKPARSCVEASKLPKGVGIEIEAVAFC